jgi:voltage-gated potassium channel
VDERSREVERRLEKPLLAFALLTIPAIALDQPGVSEPWKGIGIALNWAIWLAFLAEVVIMLSVVPDRRRWLRDHPLDLAIVILTPPVLPPALQAARLFRLFRLLRLMRAATLARHIFSTEGIRDASILTFVAVLGGGAAFAAVENQQNLSTWDGVWWAIQTVTTVGYGDTDVKTDGGRVLAICLMITGIGFVAVLTAAAADRFMRGRREAEERARAERQAIEERAQQHRHLIEERLDLIISRLDTLERR